MFRLQENVPEVYVQKSRDFQIFCRLFDYAFNSTRYHIDSIKDLSDSARCNSSILRLLKDKLGLLNDLNLDDDDLRLVLQAFPTIIRYKGSLTGLNMVVNLFQRLTNKRDNLISYDIVSLKEDHILLVTFKYEPPSLELFIQLLEYIMPTGYIVKCSVLDYRHLNLHVSEHDTVAADIPDSTNTLTDYAQVADPNTVSSIGTLGLALNVGHTQVAGISTNSEIESQEEV